MNSTLTFPPGSENAVDPASHQGSSVQARQRLFVALDFPNDPKAPTRIIEPDDAKRLVEKLGELVDTYKVGWALYLVGHDEIVRWLRDQGKRVFLDLKFGDIGETIRRLVAVAIRNGVELTTVNTTFQTVRAAVEAAQRSQLKILTLTVLTSLDDSDLLEQGIGSSVEQHVLYKTKKAREIGCHGVVASGREARAIREATDSEFLIVTPGIRPAGSAADDHKRSCTPTDAILAGADYLVVGRPITLSKDPHAATAAILDEMQAAFDKR
ncbi:MAG: orotidine-5'-phosphate decarboxylase [Gemmatimonadaceae bacterium]